MVMCFCANDDDPFACDSNSTCEVNGYCYASMQIIYDDLDRPVELRRSAGCLYNNESGLLLVGVLMEIGRSFNKRVIFHLTRRFFSIYNQNSIKIWF